MRHIFMFVVLLMLGGGALSQPMGAAKSPDIEMLWQVLGSVSAIEIDLAGTDVNSVHVSVMFQGDELIRDSLDVDSDEGSMLSINAGTLNAGHVAWCDEAYAVAHVRYVTRFGNTKVAATEACVGGTGGRRVSDFPSEPFGIPYRVYGRHVELPTGRWLLFGLTFVETNHAGLARVHLEETIAYYVYLSPDPAPPAGPGPFLPTYESIREAERAYGTP